MKNMIDFEKYPGILRKTNIYRNSANFRFYANQLFGSLDFTGKRVLEIGAGKGAFSCYFALKGASEVVALEPESDGSNPEMLEKFNGLIHSCGVADVVRLLPLTFQEYDNAGKPFDIIVSHNSINHLDERACEDLLHRLDAKTLYSDLFGKMYDMQSKKGVLVIADCARHNFWGGIGLKTPITYAINWKKHQQPRTWMKFIRAAGYKKRHLRWNSINTFGSLGSMLLNNYMAAYLLNSHFTLTSEKA